MTKQVIENLKDMTNGQLIKYATKLLAKIQKDECSIEAIVVLAEIHYRSTDLSGIGDHFICEFIGFVNYDIADVPDSEKRRIIKLMLTNCIQGTAGIKNTIEIMNEPLLIAS